MAVVLGSGLAVSLAACAGGGGSGDFTPKPIVTISPSAPTQPTVSATSASPSATPTPTPTPTPSVKATGTLAFYSPASKALAGTCRSVAGVPTITLADHANEAFKAIDLTVRLDSGKKAVTSIAGTLSEDSEGFTWKLSYAYPHSAAGTSAALKVVGNTYTISGKLASVETRGSKTIKETLPFTLVATCAGSAW